MLRDSRLDFIDRNAWVRKMLINLRLPDWVLVLFFGGS